MKPILRTRTEDDKNYHAIFVNGKTMRFYIRDDEEMLAPTWPELYDVSINNKCMGGCSYCYASAKRTGRNYANIVTKARNFWGRIDPENRPFQIAVGGAGEPTEHPDFVRFMEAVRQMNIMPNFTTNGMIINDRILECSVETCGGVAVSAHDHLEHIWSETINLYSNAGARTNMHVVIGVPGSLDKLKRLCETYTDSVEYFVLLPYISQGRATKIDTSEEWDNLFAWLKTFSRQDLQRFAFGAYFFDQIRDHNIPCYTYDIHMFSKYIDFDVMQEHESSFHGTGG